MNTEIYNKKMTALQAALKKVEAILEQFAAGERDPGRWNNTHDLFDRIEERICRLNDKYIDYLSDNQISYNVGNISVIF